MIQPLVGCAALILLFVSESTLAVFLVVAGYVSLAYTLNNCMRETMYIPIPLGLKVHTKSMIAILVPQIGASVGSGVILAFGNRSVRAFLFCMGVTALIWLYLAWSVSNKYATIAQGGQPETSASVDDIR